MDWSQAHYCSFAAVLAEVLGPNTAAKTNGPVTSPLACVAWTHFNINSVLTMTECPSIKPWSHHLTRPNCHRALWSLNWPVELSWVGLCDHSEISTWQKVCSLQSVVKFWTCWEFNNWQKTDEWRILSSWVEFSEWPHRQTQL